MAGTRAGAEQGAADRLAAFAEAELDIYQWADGNELYGALDEVVRYRRFVDLVLERIDRDREALDKAMRESQDSLRNYAGGTLSPTQRLADRRIKDAEHVIHLDIESLYLFVKVVLDRSAVAIWTYFGQARGCSLASHDSFRKKLARYASQKNLAIPAGLCEQAENLQLDIEFRDKELVHRYGGAIRGTTWNMDPPTAQIVIAPNKQTRDPRALVRAVDEYVDALIGLMSTNRAQSSLCLKGRSNLPGGL